ncbi:NAD(P)H-hydrate epimerase [Fusarium oxysporum f. sp. albedinis]|nr:NAD(P)H-hydrate epimerase [Fusarium oxysporum f. sp. albedinis]
MRSADRLNGAADAPGLKDRTCLSVTPAPSIRNWRHPFSDSTRLQKNPAVRGLERFRLGRSAPRNRYGSFGRHRWLADLSACSTCHIASLAQLCGKTVIGQTG